VEGGLVGLPQIVSSTDVWPPPFFTFEYFASLDNHRAQKDSSTADTYIYYTYYIYFVRNVNSPANPTAATARRGIASSSRESCRSPQQKDAITI